MLSLSLPHSHQLFSLPRLPLSSVVTPRTRLSYATPSPMFVVSASLPDHHHCDLDNNDTIWVVVQCRAWPHDRFNGGTWRVRGGVVVVLEVYEALVARPVSTRRPIHILCGGDTGAIPWTRTRSTCRDWIQLWRKTMNESCIPIKFDLEIHV